MLLMVVVLKKIEKKLCFPSVGVYVPPVVESATIYKCGQVQSAEEYICRWILLILRVHPKNSNRGRWLKLYG